MVFDKKIVIGNKIISEESPVFVIAEAGVNHNGDMLLAKQMIDAAADAGADAVKFQAFKTEGLILKNVGKAPYQKKTTDGGESQYDMLKRLELSEAQMRELMDYCKEKEIIFLSTPFEKDSLDSLNNMGVPAFKIAATDLTNIQFLKQTARKGKPIILSAGMCYADEVKMALEAVQEINRQVVLLQCTANYPIRDEEVNLKVIETFREQYDMLTGYSDHSKGIGAAPYAAVLGARVIEKHFTLDKSLPGPDQKASVTPEELKEMIKDIRRAEKYLGNGKKIPSCSEQMTRKSLQKCMVASQPIKCGERFSEENIVAKRTNGEGISALYYETVLGLAARRDYETDDLIMFE